MLKKVYYKYLQTLLIFSIIIACVYILLKLLISHQLLYNVVSDKFPFLIVIFVFVTAITHYIVARTDVERIECKSNAELCKEEQMKKIAAIERKFVTQFLFITTVKLLSFLILLAVYAWLNKSDAILFLLNFIVVYLMYTIFEIWCIQKRKSNRFG